MELSEILNVVLGGSLVGALISIVTIRSALKKARAEAEKALAEADTVKITNTDQATRILVENIVKPLTEELNETRKEIGNCFESLEEAEKALEKLKAWKRLRDKGFRFDGVNGCWIEFTLKSANSDKEYEQGQKDLLLLFGGEE